MGDFQVSMTTLCQNLGDLVNRVAYGGERVVLVSRGEPIAAIISIQDLRKLGQSSVEKSTEQNQSTNVLETADRVRERIRRWQEAHGIEPGDSVENLLKLREERDGICIGLRK